MTVIISNGRPASVAAKSYPFPSTSSNSNGPNAGFLPLLRGDAAATYEAIYRAQPMLHAVVSKLVYGVARNPLKAYQYGLDGESRDRVRAHPAARIIKRPHPYGTEFSLKAAITRDLLIHGNALCVKVRERGAGSTPVELWPVPWQKVIVITDDHGVTLGYQVVVDGEALNVGREEVVHIPLPTGSPIEPLRRTLALEDAAQMYQGENMRNGISPRAAFLSDTRLPDAVIPRLREELGKLYAGPENAGSVAIIDNGLKPERIGMTPVDMAVIDQRKLSREEVCAVYDIAPTLLGLERGTYASVTEYRRGLYDAIATKLVLIEETMNAQLVETEPAWDGIFLEFDTNELLRPDPEARARMHMLTQQAGVTSINERRRAENLPAIDDPSADAVLAPVNMQVVGDGREEVAAMSLRERIDAVGILIRSGFSPEDAAATVGLPEMEYLAVRPVTVQPLAIDATQVGDPNASPDDVLDLEDSTDNGTPAQGATDSAALIRSITDALIDRPKSRRIERDDFGNILRIVEE